MRAKSRVKNYILPTKDIYCAIVFVDLKRYNTAKFSASLKQRYRISACLVSKNLRCLMVLIKGHMHKLLRF